MSRYDLWKLSSGDDFMFRRTECVVCHDDSRRSGEMIEVADELVCSNDCLEQYQAEHLCKNCGKAHIRTLIRTALGNFCGQICHDDYLSERRAEIDVLPEPRSFIAHVWGINGATLNPSTKMTERKSGRFSDRADAETLLSGMIAFNGKDRVDGEILESPLEPEMIRTDRGLFSPAKTSDTANEEGGGQ
jgi:hypothetical protein